MTRILREADIANQKKKWVREDEFQVNCVFCPDTKRHLYVNTTLKVFNCFKCGASGIYIPEGCIIPPILAKKSAVTPAPITERHLNYLRKRGLTPKEILHYNPQTFVGYEDYVFNCASPYVTIGRAIVDKEPKYLTIKRSSRLPFGWEWIGYNPEVLVMVEGIFDWYAVRRYNLPVVALLGKFLHRRAVTWLTSIKPEVIWIMLDADAVKDVMRLKHQLFGFQVYWVQLEKDPWEERDYLLQKPIIKLW